MSIHVFDCLLDKKEIVVCNLVLSPPTVVKRDITWNQKYSMLYIDNPVGTGFSFTDQDAGYATNEVDVGRDLYR